MNKEVKQHPILTPLSTLIEELETVSATEEQVSTALHLFALPGVSDAVRNEYPDILGSLVTTLNGLRIFFKSIQTRECVSILQEYTEHSIYATDEHMMEKPQLQSH